MIDSNNWAKEASEKLTAEAKEVTGQKEKIMEGPVLEAIKMFCEQETEFAQAVVQGGSFAECMKKVASGVGNAISDIDAYKKAVQFYFPGAVVNMQMTIDLIGTAAQQNELINNDNKLQGSEEELAVEKPKILTLDLSSFF